MQSPLLSTKSPLVSTGYPRDSPDSKASSPYSTGHPHYFFLQSKSNAPQIDKSPFFQATTNRKTRTDIRINRSKTNNYEQKLTNKPRNLLTMSPIQSNLHLFASTSPLHHPTTKKHSPPPSPPALLSLSYRRICSRSTLHFVQKQLLLHTDTPVPWQHVHRRVHLSLPHCRGESNKCTTYIFAHHDFSEPTHDEQKFAHATCIEPTIVANSA